MFSASKNDKGDILLSGRCDASQVEVVRKIFEEIDESCVVNFADLDYISSAGLGVLLRTQKRLAELECALKIVNMNKQIKNVFHHAGFDELFEIE